MNENNPFEDKTFSSATGRAASPDLGINAKSAQPVPGSAVNAPEKTHDDIGGYAGAQAEQSGVVGHNPWEGPTLPRNDIQAQAEPTFRGQAENAGVIGNTAEAVGDLPTLDTVSEPPVTAADPYAGESVAPPVIGEAPEQHRL